MTSLRSLAAAVLLTASTGAAIPAQDSAPRTLTADEARRDFDTLRQALEEAHGAPYRFVPKVEPPRATRRAAASR
jgi:cytochrome c556